MLENESRALSNSLEKTLALQSSHINHAAETMLNSIRKGGKILICGNGGSASQAQHFSAELVVRFKKNRTAMPAIALNTDSSILTACGNDFSFEHIFARQVEALSKSEDVLVCLSTSGNSPNVLRAAESAKSRNCKVISLTGEKENLLEKISDTTIKVQSLETSRIQEIHLFLIHFFADYLEQNQ